MKNKKAKKLATTLILVVLLLFLIFVVYTAITHKGISQTAPYTGHLRNYNSNIPDSERYVQDFEFIYTELKNNYVNIEYKEQILGFDFDEKYEEYKEKLHNISNEKEFYLLCSAFVSELKDGHVIFKQYQPSDQEYIGSPYPNSFRTLFAIRKIENKYMIVSTKMNEEYIGCEIKSINNIPFKDIVQGVLKYFYHGADDTCAVGKILLRDVYYHYFKYYYDKAPEELTYEIVMNGETKYLKLYPFEVESELSSKSSTINFGFVENELPIHSIENDIGYIRIDTFDSNKKELVDAFSDAVIAFKEAQVIGVVIDIRNNGGGNESFRDILSYLTDEIIDVGMYHYKKSERFKDIYFLRELYQDFMHPQIDREALVGYTKWWKWTIDPAKEQFLTTIPVAILVNECIFSSADSFANTCNNHKLATVVGNTLPSSGFGLTTDIVLPSTKYILGYGFHEGINMDGSRCENIISDPDIIVSQKVEDLMNNTDTQLESALLFIRDEYLLNK